MRHAVEAQALRVVGRPRLVIIGADAQCSVQAGAERLKGVFIAVWWLTWGFTIAQVWA